MVRILTLGFLLMANQAVAVGTVHGDSCGQQTAILNALGRQGIMITAISSTEQGDTMVLVQLPDKVLVLETDRRRRSCVFRIEEEQK